MGKRNKKKKKGIYGLACPDCSKGVLLGVLETGKTEEIAPKVNGKGDLHYIVTKTLDIEASAALECSVCTFTMLFDKEQDLTDYIYAGLEGERIKRLSHNDRQKTWVDTPPKSTDKSSNIRLSIIRKP